MKMCLTEMRKKYKEMPELFDFESKEFVQSMLLQTYMYYICFS